MVSWTKDPFRNFIKVHHEIEFACVEIYPKVPSHKTNPARVILTIKTVSKNFMKNTFVKQHYLGHQLSSFKVCMDRRLYIWSDCLWVQRYMKILQTRGSDAQVGSKTVNLFRRSVPNPQSEVLNTSFDTMS